MSDTPTSDLGRLIEVLARQAEAALRTADLIESRALPLLERIAGALERAPVVGSTPAAGGQAPGFGEFRAALDEGRWDEARAIVEGLSRAHPDDPKVAALAVELERTRQFSAEDLRQRIEAARLANDPEGAIHSRDELARLLRGEGLQDVDRPLVKWLIGLVQRRLRTGTIGLDVVTLAGKIAESFGGTAEGASLNASLPTLRRSAGLCPKCAEPYKGVGDACPKCLAASPAALPTSPGPDEISDEDDPDAEIIGEPIDLNHERYWQNP